MRRALAIPLLAAAAALVALAMVGCASKGVLNPDSQLHTTIFIQGPVDTVNHVVHLYWFGTDTHGYILGYEVRLLNPEAPADTSWRFTTRTDSVITVVSPNGFSASVFEARAINDRGVRDPNPAREAFKFRNTPPIVKFVTGPNAGDHSDTTFASATVTWSVSDPDGDPTKVVSRLWLNGQANNPVVGVGTTFTVPSAAFLQGGVYLSGPRTLYLQGIDDGGMAGPIDSTRWYVRQPVPLVGGRARLLLVDDYPTATPNSPDPQKVRVDTLYAHAVANTGIPANQWSVLHIQRTQPFRSAKDIEQTFKLFETVVWYRGEQGSRNDLSRPLPPLQTDFSMVLANFGAGIGPYLDGGGRLFIESLNLTSDLSPVGGTFDPDFVSRYMNSDGTFLCFPTGAPDSSSSWSLPASGVLRFPTLSDSLQNRRPLAGVRAFRTRSASQVFIVAPAHTLSPDTPIDLPIGLDVPQAAGGRFIVSSYPFVSGTISTPGFPQRASIVLLKVLQHLGLGP